MKWENKDGVELGMCPWGFYECSIVLEDGLYTLRYTEREDGEFFFMTVRHFDLPVLKRYMDKKSMNKRLGKE